MKMIFNNKTQGYLIHVIQRLALIIIFQLLKGIFNYLVSVKGL